ncbi:MAG: phosphomethylpyrimidine synthase ThiC [archaeon]
MTELQSARSGEITPAMKAVASAENIAAERLCKDIASGVTILVKNLGIGSGLRTKVNANIGSSPAKADVCLELEKLKVAIGAGADTVMDLSTGGDIDAIRRAIIKNSSVPVGTVPIYQAVVDRDSIVDLSANDFLKGISRHIDDGVDFITVHCGVLKAAIPLVDKRLMGAVSRGGSFLLKWMEHNNSENPLYENFDKVIEMARKKDVVLSLGDGLRPGCIRDATDSAQIHELNVLGELGKRAFDDGVQVMIEGPGHVPINQIRDNIEMQKKICHGAPFYVLGPLVTDIAPGYDHLTAAIGGALAASYGADFLCYVTPAEHLGLPDASHVKEGVIASRIAAHAADLAKGLPGAADWDLNMSKARKNLDWHKMMELSIDPEKSRAIREICKPDDPNTCSMCDKFCSIKVGKD